MKYMSKNDILILLFSQNFSIFIELLEKIAMCSEDDQCIRPTFPEISSEEGYNLQLLSALEVKWLSIKLFIIKMW